MRQMARIGSNSRLQLKLLTRAPWRALPYRAAARRLFALSQLLFASPTFPGSTILCSPRRSGLTTTASSSALRQALLRERIQ
jgi:hypothetical protein